MRRNYQSSRPSPAATAATHGSKITSEPLVPAPPCSTSDWKLHMRRESLYVLMATQRKASPLSAHLWSSTSPRQQKCR